MTIQQAAQAALDVQNACNLSGVLASFKEIVHEVIWPEAHRLGKGTEWVNTHPVCSLFLDKLASLNHLQCLCSESLRHYHDAYIEVEKLAQSKILEPETIAWG